MSKRLAIIISILILMFVLLACSDHSGYTPEEACRIEHCR